MMAQSSCIEAEVQVVGDCVSLLQFLDYDVYITYFNGKRTILKSEILGKLMGK
jgi:hypothetical protein